MILAVDPGCRGCGVAIFDGGELHSATYVKNPIVSGLDARAASEMATAVWAWVGRLDPWLVIEVPRVYDAAHQKGDQNDLIAVALVAGALAGRFHVAQQYFPRDWKGTLDADTLIEKWIIPRVMAKEHARVILPRAKDLAHNVWDAVGIGLKHVGRLEVKRIFSKEP